jgi:hypothetical protein
VLLNQPLARAAQLQPRAVDQQVQGLGMSTRLSVRPRHLQGGCSAAQRGMVRHPQRQTKATPKNERIAFGRTVEYPQGEIPARTSAA